MHPLFTIPLSRVLILVTLSIVLPPLVIQANAQAATTTNHEEFLPPAPQGQQWRLTWHDEFEGDQLDESKWNRLGDWKRRDGYWVQDDAYLSGKGTLLLRTRKEGDRYTSGAINTAGKFEHAFGYCSSSYQLKVTSNSMWRVSTLMASRSGACQKTISGQI
jgi:beta-glucanase (GH16 family)